MALFVPSAGFCVEEDPYVYRLLFGKVYFEFEKGTVEEDGRRQDHSRFQQTYSLDTLGNIFSSRLIIYDAGVTFTNNDYETVSTETNTKTTSYYLNTKILPRSAIPLLIFMNRSTNSITTGSSDLERTSTVYGLNWFLNLKTLPVTKVYVKRSVSESASTEQTTTSYQLDMTKHLGPTENELSYRLETSESNSESGLTSSVFNFNNRTHISRSTLFSLGATTSSTENEDSVAADTKQYGLTLGLESKPSIDTSQTHRYTYYNTSSGDNENTGGFYTGDMYYRFTDRFDTNFGISLSETESDSPTMKETAESFGANFGLNYRISDNLSLSEAVSYSSFTTNSDTGLNTQDHKLLSALTRIAYSKRLTWAQLATSYGLGYREEQSSQEGSGTGLEQNISVSLSDINVNPYVSFNTSVSWSDVTNLSGDVWSNSKTFDLSAANKLWKRYAIITGSYTKSESSSWIEVSDNKSEKLRLNALSTYFRNTRIELFSEHANTFDAISGFGQVDTESASITHNRYLLGGTLDLGANYTLTDSVYAGGSDSFTNKTLSARYSKRLLRDLNWALTAQRSENKGSRTFTKTSSVTNSFIYNLRAWLLSADHKYIITEDLVREQVESTILFRATRQFVRFL